MIGYGFGKPIYMYNTAGHLAETHGKENSYNYLRGSNLLSLIKIVRLTKITELGVNNCEYLCVHVFSSGNSTISEC